MCEPKTNKTREDNVNTVKLREDTFKGELKRCKKSCLVISRLDKLTPEYSLYELILSFKRLESPETCLLRFTKCPRLRIPHSSFAHQAESQMRQRSQVATGSHSAFLWHPRQTGRCFFYKQREN